MSGSSSKREILTVGISGRRDVVVVLTVIEVDGRVVFGGLARHGGISCIRALQGPHLAFALHKQHSVPSLMNWRTGEVVNLLPTPDVLVRLFIVSRDSDHFSHLCRAVSGLFLDKIRVFSVQGLNHSGRPWVPMNTHSFSSENRLVSLGTHEYPPFLTAMSCAQSAN